jgi:hypothetical protein
VKVVDTLPADHTEDHPAYTSVRWRLTDAVPERDDARLLVVVQPGAGAGSRPTRLRPPPYPPTNTLRTPTTPDGRWEMQLPPGRYLKVLRKAAPPTSVVLSASLDEATVILTCAVDGDGPTQLMFLTKDDKVAGAVPMQQGSGTATARITADDVPGPGRYRVAVGTPDRRRMVQRRYNDVAVAEPTSVLMPLVLDRDHSQVVGRFIYSNQGVLLLIRRAADEDDRETAP